MSYSAMSEPGKIQAGRYATTKNSVSDRSKEVGICYENLPEISGINRQTIDQANNGGPSYRSTLTKIGKHLLNTSWQYFLDEKHHTDLKKGASEFIDAVGSGEEFAALRRLGSRLMIRKSLGDSEIKVIGNQLKRLCLATKQNPNVAFHALWQHSIVHGDYEVAIATAHTMLDNAGSNSKLAHAHRAIGERHFYTGNFQMAIDHLDHIAISKFTQDDDWGEPFGLDVKAAAYGHACIAQAITGEIDLALETAQLAVARSERIEHEPSIIFAKHCDSVLHYLLRNPTEAHNKAASVLEVAETYPFPQIEALAQLVIAWARGMQGEEVSRRDILEPFSKSRDLRTRVSRPLWLTLIAECLEARGDYWIAAHMLDDAIEWHGDSGDAFSAAETHRLKADILLTCLDQDGKKEAAQHYRKAIDIANKQGAFFFQLRAATAYYKQITRKSDRKYAREKMREALLQIKGCTPEIENARKIWDGSRTKKPNRPR